MLRLGVIGTNWITDSFIEGGHLSGTFRLGAVYSRKLDTARQFAEKYRQQAPLLFDDLDGFLAADTDVVYIASPNSLHFAQAMAAMGAGKHVVVEKPAFSNSAETEKAFALARQKGVLLLEAARHIHEANFKKLAALVPTLGEIRGVGISYMQYSARYDLVLAGQEPNIFSPRFSGGALMDLGVYVVYAALALFGTPLESRYYCQKIRTGVDGGGVMLFRYDGFDAVLRCGKTAPSYQPSEINGSDGVLLMPEIQYIDSLRRYSRADDAWQEHAAPKRQNWMEEEAECFAALLADPAAAARREYDRLEGLALETSRLITAMRLENGIRFSADG